MATVYLSPTGSDSYTYVQAQSISTPWLTPAKVQASATTGDTVSVASGTYTIAATTTWTKSFTWTAQTNYAAIFDAANVNYYWDFGANQTFNGIKFYRWKHNTSFGCIFIVPASSKTITFDDCIFDSMKLNAYIANLGSVFGTNNVNNVNFVFNRCIISNITYDTSATGTSLFGFRNGDATCGVALNNCTIYLPSSTNTIANILNDGGSSGKPVVSGKSNILYTASAIAWGATGATLTYSDGYNITSFPTNTGNITSDPLFVDAANSNFNLRPTSPCIGTGSV